MTDTIQDRLRDDADDFDWPVSSDTAHAAAAHIDAQDAKIKALVGALESAVDQMTSDWHLINNEFGVECTTIEREVASGEFIAMAKARAALAAAKETT